MKKITAVILTFMLLLGSVTLGVPEEGIRLNFGLRAFAASEVASGKCGDNLTWVLDSDGTLTISGTGEMENWWYSSPWYSNRTSVKKVVVESGVTSIGDYAFYKCTNLRNVSISATVEVVGSGVFESCTYLEAINVDAGNSYFCSIDGVLFNEDVTTLLRFPTYKVNDYSMPDSVTTIGAYAFSRCSQFGKLTLSKNLKVIEEYSFYLCSALEDITFPESVIEIKGRAFDSTYLETVTLPANIEKFSIDSFDDCGVLKEINVDAANEYYCSIDGVLFDKSAKKLILCPEGKSGCYAVPEGVTCIGEHSFSGCKNLTEIIFPDSLTDFYMYALYGCESLKEVVIPQGVEAIAYGMLQSCSSMEYLYIPKSVVKIERDAIDGCDSLKEVRYRGSQSEWESISVVTDYGSNTDLIAADIRFNYTAEKIASGTYGFGVSWVLDSEGTFTVSGNGEMNNRLQYHDAPWSDYRDSIRKVVIEEGITYIGSSAFHKHTSIISVELPSTVTEISSNAFSECTKLESINIPSQLNQLGDYAFQNCALLGGEIELPDTVTEIGTAAFEGCSSLQKVIINGNIEVLKYYLFHKCTSLTEVLLPQTLLSIEAGAFEKCSSLKKIHIPASVSQIGPSAFSGCASLEYAEIAGTIDLIESSTFRDCISLSEVTLPSSITKICSDAFRNCTSLNAVVLPQQLLTIEGYAFNNCSALAEVVFGPSVAEIGTNAFNSCSSLKNISLPPALEKIGYAAFSNCSSAKGTLIIPSSLSEMGIASFANCGFEELIFEDGCSLTSIPESAFRACDSMKGTLIIPSTITEIGERAFYCCGFDKLMFEEESSLTSIAAEAFADCYSLAGELSIPSSVTNIAASAFSGVTKITSLSTGNGVDNLVWLFSMHLKNNLEIITIGSSISDIPDNRFEYFRQLKSVILPESLNRIGSGAFSNCSSLTDIIIPDSVNVIAQSTFINCTSLTDVTIPDSVTSIGSSVFSGCTSLTSITIPDSVTSIGSGAFSGCTSLTSITIPDSVTSIGSSAFSGCTSLTSITIPDSVTSIGSRAFYSCDSLTSVTIPDSVTSIGSGAFSGCSALASVTIGESVTLIGSYAFDSCTSLTSVTIPDSVTRIGSEAFYSCTSLTSVTIHNPDCSIYDYSSTISSSATIYGYQNSTAQAYAEEYNRKFVALDAPITGTTPTTVNAKDIKITLLALKNTIANPITADDYIPTPMLDEQTVSLGRFGSFTKAAGTPYASIKNTLTDELSSREYLEIYAPGYRDYICHVEVYNDKLNAFYNNNQYVVNLRQLQKGDDTRPYVSTLMYYNPSDMISKNVLDASCEFIYGRDETVELRAYGVWHDKTPDYYVLYQRDGVELISSDGKFVFNAGGTFMPEKSVYIKMVATDGTESISEHTGIKISGDMPEVLESGYAYVIPKTTKTTIDEKMPILGSEKLEIDMIVPVTVDYEGDKIRIAFGCKKLDDAGKEQKFTEEDWDRWKKISEDYQKTGKLPSSSYIKNNLMKWTGTLQLECKVAGYYEGSVVGGDSYLEGGIIFSTEVEGAFQKQILIQVGPVPVPIYLKGGTEMKLEAALDGGYNLTESRFYSDVDCEVTPKLVLELGVGVLYAVTVGVKGEVSLPSVFSLSKGFESVKLTGKASITASVLCFEGEISTPEYDLWQIYPQNARNAVNKSSLSENTLAAPDFSLASDMFEDVKAREQLTDIPQQPVLKMSANEETVIDSNVYPLAKPKINLIGDDYEVVTWIGYDLTRNAANANALMYSTARTDGSASGWTEPKILVDDGTADFYPDVIGDGNSIYAVWQNIGSVYDNSSADINAYSKDSEISYATINFGEFFTTYSSDELTENESMDAMPRISHSSNGKLELVWMTNSTDDLLGIQGKNTIVRRDRSTGEAVPMLSDLPIVTSYDYAELNGKLYVAACVDTDNDLATLDDRVIKLADTDGNIIGLNYGGLDSNPIFADYNGQTALYWYCDNSIMAFCDGVVMTLYTDDSGMMTDDFTVISGDEGQMIIAWTAVNDEGRKYVEGIVYDAEADAWSREIEIASSAYDMYYPSGIFRDDGTVDLVYNRTDSSGKSDLCLMNLTPEYDIAVIEAYCDQSLVAPKTALPVTLYLKNNGNTTIREVDINIDGQISRHIISLIPGCECDVQAFYSTPESVSEKELEITVSVSGQIDTDLNDNTYKVLVGQSDARLTIDDTRINGNHIVGINAIVDTYSEMNGELQVRKNSVDGDIIDTVDLGTLKQGEVKLITYTILSTLTEMYDDLHSVYFVLETDCTEQYLSNNYDFIGMAASAQTGSIRLPGDINSDGKVSLLDSTVLRRWLAGWDGVTINETNADVNGDGEVTLLDSIILRRYLAGWSGVELK